MHCSLLLDRDTLALNGIDDIDDIDDIDKSNFQFV